MSNKHNNPNDPDTETGIPKKRKKQLVLISLIFGILASLGAVSGVISYTVDIGRSPIEVKRLDKKIDGEVDTRQMHDQQMHDQLLIIQTSLTDIKDSQAEIKKALRITAPPREKERINPP